MDKHSVWKWLILFFVLTLSIASVIPPGKKIRLGLDLRGGTSFTVSIDKDQIIDDIKREYEGISQEDLKKELAGRLENFQGKTVEVLRNRIDQMGIEESIIYPGKDNRIIIQLPGVDPEVRERARRNILSVARLGFHMVHEDNDELTQDLFDQELAPEDYVITSVEGMDFYRKIGKSSDVKETEEEIRTKREALRSFNVPDSEHMFMLVKDVVKQQEVYRPYFVEKKAELTGESLEYASVDYSSLTEPMVQIRFDGKGAAKFRRITTDYVPRGRKNPTDQPRALAIVLDDTLYSAPVIHEPIRNGRAVITGRFTPDEATFLANILKAGSLPARVAISETRTVSPSLGTDSIESGVKAIIIGGIATVLFMLFYYRICGFVADMALILNMLLLPIGMIITAGFLGIFAAGSAPSSKIELPVLTLPGLAGILLAIGMAVDTNILIYERIREELKTGKRLWAAITAGYDRAFITILDSNLTTLLTGIILFIFGSGPVRGFAVTLCAGIMISMFTGLVITKLLLGLLVNKTSIRDLKMLSLFGNPSFNFLKIGKLCMTLSILVIIGTMASAVYKGISKPSSVLGVDFTGGVSVSLGYDTAGKVAIGDVRDALENAGLSETHIQYHEDMKGQGSFLQVWTSLGDVEEGQTGPVKLICDTLIESFPGAKYKFIQEDEVGSQVGKELQKSALISIVLALIGMIAYISWRFEFGFAIGAIAALFHDVLVTAGLYCLMGRQLNLQIVAVLLTIVGYSVNDTIVIFDRIREDLRLSGDKDFRSICNLSINQTLSRTVLTTVTTLLAVGSLILFGGGAVGDFAISLFIGIVAGAYSTVYVATPVVLAWHKGKVPRLAGSSK